VREVLLLTLNELRVVIHEALKKSDVEKLTSALEFAAGRMGSRVRADADTSKKMVNVFAKLVSGDAEQVEQVLVDEAEKLGWSLLSRSERNGTTWWFEPKPETKGSTKKLPQFLWHMTPAENAESILSTGFEPRQRTAPGTQRRYSPRIYFASDPGGAKATVKNADGWVMLKVDRTKLPKNTKFYVDQEFGHKSDGSPTAVFTLDPITPSAISVVESHT